MATDTQAPSDVSENPKTDSAAEAFPARPSRIGMKAMQGESADLTQAPEAKETVSPANDPGPGAHPVDRERKLEYRLGSPHDEFELYWDLEKAQRRTDLGRDATLADEDGVAGPADLPGAVVTTLRVAQESKEQPGKLEEQTREWMRLKHGPAPYTEAAYPEPDPVDDPQSLTDEDILLSQVKDLREEEEKAAREDATRLKDKFPKPAWKQ
ncbi:MAG: hypothetical protein NT154_06205 [Verrucomicrobia bacterium]|nr:hypothetical protein [Verrucomicrobiota bacterium]